MKTTELRAKLNRACIQHNVDTDVRRALATGGWKEVMNIGKGLTDEQIDAVLGDVFPEATVPVIAAAVKHRRHWLTRTEEVNEDQLLMRLQIIAGYIGCAEMPTKVHLNGFGSPRRLQDGDVPKVIDPAWLGVLASVNSTMDQRPDMSEFDCRLVNAVIQEVHPESGRLARIYFVCAFLGALHGEPNPWKDLWELCVDGLLVEAFYADGTVQLATRVM